MIDWAELGVTDPAEIRLLQHDRRLYGNSYIKDGQRIDPQDLYTTSGEPMYPRLPKTNSGLFALIDILTR